jgi:hypothetical protein
LFSSEECGLLPNNSHVLLLSSVCCGPILGQIEHAYEVLSNDLRRRDYDLFQIDELESRIAEAKKQYANSPVESIPFPLWEPPPAGMKQLSTLFEPSFRVNMTRASCV